mmetsp:Transcript_128390/g.357394  ORF Transcript_128390/g.357394 Transcript_128390/m.357394 type:complete len:219 (-) Transcript_128390:501-1157(-)
MGTSQIKGPPLPSACSRTSPARRFVSRTAASAVTRRSSSAAPRSTSWWTGPTTRSTTSACPRTSRSCTTWRSPCRGAGSRTTLDTRREAWRFGVQLARSRASPSASAAAPSSATAGGTAQHSQFTWAAWKAAQLTVSTWTGCSSNATWPKATPWVGRFRPPFPWRRPLPNCPRTSSSVRTPTGSRWSRAIRCSGTTRGRWVGRTLLATAGMPSTTSAS